METKQDVSVTIFLGIRPEHFVPDERAFAPIGISGSAIVHLHDPLLDRQILDGAPEPSIDPMSR